MILTEIIDRFDLHGTYNTIGNSFEYGLVIYNYQDKCSVVEDCDSSGTPLKNNMIKFFNNKNSVSISIEVLREIDLRRLDEILYKHKLIPNKLN